MSPRAIWNDGPEFERHLETYGAPAVALRSICSGGGGSPGQTQSTQQSKSSNEPPEFIQPYLKSAIGDLSNLYTGNPTAPDYYPGSTVAPQSGETQQAIDMMAARGAGGSPVTAAAQGNVTDTLNGRYLDPTSNPEFKTALEAALRPQTEQFMGTVIPGITSAFEGSGRTGSGAHQEAVDRATTSFNRTQADASAKAGADYFTSARAQQLQAAGMAPQLAATDYADLAALGEAGAAKDTRAQSQTDADIARYNYGNNAQWDYIGRYLNMLNGGYPGGVTNSSGTSTSVSTPTGGGLSSILGAGSSALGMGMMAMSMFSDERLKEGIEPVGKMHDGQTVYSYRYKGDPTPRIGLLAQEVEKRHPEAVHVDPASGYRKVNYELATREARGLF